MKRYILILAILSGCTPEFDMQGVDPNQYYAQHPIENRLEARQLSQLVHFAPAQAALSDDEKDKLRAGLHPISPPAVDSILIQLAQADKYNQARKASLVRLLRQMGYKINVRFEPSVAVVRGDAQIDIAYSVVVAPDCPDWRTSPVTSYSNTMQGNFKCATVVNLGLMVADPHDLVRGPGDVTPDTERSSKVLQDYHSGKDFMAPTLAAGSSSSGSSSGGSGGSSGGSASTSIGGMNSAVAAGTAGLTGSSSGGGQ